MTSRRSSIKGNEVIHKRRSNRDPRIDDNCIPLYKYSYPAEALQHCQQFLLPQLNHFESLSFILLLALALPLSNGWLSFEVVSDPSELVPVAGEESVLDESAFEALLGSVRHLPIFADVRGLYCWSSHAVDNLSRWHFLWLGLCGEGTRSSSTTLLHLAFICICGCEGCVKVNGVSGWPFVAMFNMFKGRCPLPCRGSTQLCVVWAG